MSPAPEKVPSLAESVDWRAPEITDILERALAEDIGTGDLTTEAVVPDAAPAAGAFIAKEALVVAGLPLAGRLFALLDPQVQFRALVEEGVLASRGVRLAEVRGDARALLRGERVALNFLQRLSGIATLTRRFVFRLRGTRAQLRDTRKTTPGLRLLERYAVRVGGGANHRFGLYDAVLIKDNHAALAGGVGAAVRRAREKYGRERPLEVEVRDAVEVLQALEAGADLLLLDNMNVEQVDLAMEEIRRRGRAQAEVSGGIRLENVRAYAECGVDFISVGALTHSAPAADISFDVESLKELK
jgi:nicotinate-nucleotide pyrophosphorylase (carboxylating)